MKEEKVVLQSHPIKFHCQHHSILSAAVPCKEKVPVGEAGGCPCWVLVDNCLVGRPFYRLASEDAEAGGS